MEDYTPTNVIKLSHFMIGYIISTINNQRIITNIKEIQ